MSVSRACWFVESEPGMWYLLLAHHEYGEINEQDAAAYGPFNSEDAADTYLFDNFANPGSSWIFRYGAKYTAPDMAKLLIAKAKNPNKEK